MDLFFPTTSLAQWQPEGTENSLLLRSRTRSQRLPAVFIPSSLLFSINIVRYQGYTSPTFLSSSYDTWTLLELAFLTSTHPAPFHKTFHPRLHILPSMFPLLQIVNTPDPHDHFKSLFLFCFGFKCKLSVCELNAIILGHRHMRKHWPCSQFYAQSKWWKWKKKHFWLINWAHWEMEADLILSCK